MRVVVIGGGVAGCFAAYYLLRRGHAVKLVDNGNPNKASFFNSGAISNPPSFTSIDIGTDISADFRKRGPVYASPEQMTEHPLWFAKTARASASSYNETTATLTAMSLGLYNEFFSTEKAEVDEIRGALKLYGKRETAMEKAKEASGRFVDSAEATAMGFKGFGGGVFSDTTRIEPRKLCLYLTDRIGKMSGEVIEGREVRLKRDPDDPSAAVADGEEFAADAYVLAGGGWSNELCKPLGYSPQVLPARGFALLCETAGTRAFDYPATFEDNGIAVVPFTDTQMRITSFFELVGHNSDFAREREKWLLDSVVSHMARNSKLSVVERGVGFRPCTPDQLPVVGRVPGFRNAYLATGGCRKGLALAPVMGNLVASLISGESVDESLMTRLSPSRLG